MSKIIVTREFNTVAEAIAFLNGSAANVGQLNAISANMPDMVIGHGAGIVGDDEGPTNANAPAVDVHGIPWDERIHAKTKATNADGSWRGRRGVTKELIAQVEAELKARGNGGMYMPQHQQQPGPGPQMQPQQQYQQPQPGPGPQRAPIDEMLKQYQQPQPGPGPQMQPQQQYQQPQIQPLDFNSFMGHVMGKLQGKDANGQPLMDHNYLVTVVQRLNAQFQRQYGSITDISNDPQVISYAQQLMQMDQRW